MFISCEYIPNDDKGPALSIVPTILFGSSSDEISYGIEAGDDGNYIVLGEKDNKGYWLKLTPNGETVWTKTLDSIVAFSAKKISGGYVISAYTNGSSGPPRPTVIAIGNAGNELWRREGLSTIVEVLSDGSLISDGFIGRQRVLTKTDAMGFPLWQRFFQIPGGITMVRPDGFWLFYEQLKPGRFHEFSQTYYVKTDFNGDSLGVFSLDSTAYGSLAEGDHGENFLAGYNYPDLPSYQLNLVLNKIDSLGEVRVVQRIPTFSTGELFIKQVNDGSFCIISKWYDGIIFLKFSADGTWLGTKVYDSGFNLNVTGIVVLLSGEVAVTGTAIYNRNERDIFIMLFDSDGIFIR